MIKFIFILLIPETAFAYIDPGTGAYFIQLLLAFVGALIFYTSHPTQLIKLILAKWHAFKQRFKKDKL